jgi:uncharacterized protein YbjT (DUF2867 family)
VPVLVTGAHRPLARRIAARLLEVGGEVRAHGRGDVAALRAAGAIVASGDADDEGHLESALADVHTVVHVGRGLLAPSAAVLVDEATVLARAAAGAGVRRVIALSVTGADTAAPDPFRAAMGEVERAFAVAAFPSVVARLSLVDTPAVRDALATAGLSDDERGRLIAPTRGDDVVELVAAFDDLRSSAPTGHATFLADGPTTLTLGSYLERVGVGRPGGGSLVGRRVADPDRVPMLLPALTGPWVSDPSSELPDAWRFTGVTPGPVAPV